MTTEKKQERRSSLDTPIDLVARVVAAVIGGPPEHQRDQVCGGIAIDSREVQPGDLFVAIPGDRVDGHDFVTQAFDRGAVAALVSRSVRNASRPLLRVEDTVNALGRFALWHRNRLSTRVVGITGSLGKTTTKDLTAAVLSRRFRCRATAGNQNNELGVALTLLNLRREDEVLVSELAMRGGGQISYLCRLARPEIGVITTIAYSHIEILGSQDAIAAAKGELLDFLPSGGKAILPGDDRYLPYFRRRLLPDVGVACFGHSPGGPEDVQVTYRGAERRPDPLRPDGEPRMGGSLVFHQGGLSQTGWVPLPGSHNARNAAAAAATGLALGMTWPEILDGLCQAGISEHRTAIEHLPTDILLLDDAYNASSPEGMHAALDLLLEVQGRRRVAVLGSMLELGEMAARAHQEVGQAVARRRPDLLITVGEDAEMLAAAARESGYPEQAAHHAPDRNAAADLVARLVRPGDAVLVKGSRGVALELVVERLKQC